MDKKKISLNGLKKVMSPKEMQNVLGGSNQFDPPGGGKGSCCYVEDNNGNGWFYGQPPGNDDEHWECNTPLAYSYCSAVC